MKLKEMSKKFEKEVGALPYLLLYPASILHRYCSHHEFKACPTQNAFMYCTTTLFSVQNTGVLFPHDRLGFKLKLEYIAAFFFFRASS